MNPDVLPDSPDLGDPYCPGCQPDVDPLERRSDGRVWVSRVCDMCGARTGDADGLVPGAPTYLSGAAESGDQDSRRMIALLGL